MINQCFTMSKAKFIILRKEPEDLVWQLFKDHVQPLKGDQYMGDVNRAETPDLKTAFFVQRTSGNGALGFLDRLHEATQSYIDTTVAPLDGACVPISFSLAGIGRPKLCEISHKALVAVSNAFLKELPGDKSYMPLTWYIAVALPFENLTGLTRVAFDLWEKINNHTDTAIKMLRKEGVSQLCTPPIEIAQMKMKGATNLVDCAMTGGQPINRGLFDKVAGVGQELAIVYMSTECLLISLHKKKTGEDFVAFDSGFPTEGVQIRILSEDNLCDLPAGETGRIAVRSPWLMTKYVGDPEKSKSVWLKDGWFLTEDMGYLKSDGHLVVYGRAGDVISRGIMLIVPGWLEKPISAHPDVIEVVVAPVPDVVNINNTCACVVKKSGSNLTEQDIINLVSNSMAEGFKDQFPIDYAMFFEDCLPRVSRAELGKIAADNIGLTK